MYLYYVFYLFILYLELSETQNQSISSLKSRLSEISDENQRIKRSQAESEKDKASLELNLKSLQQRYDQMYKSHEVHVHVHIV